MSSIYTKGFLSSAGKKMAPVLSKILNRKPFVFPITALTNYLALIQGKGAGSGWDMAAETKIAVTHITRDDAVVFDVGANIGKWSESVRNSIGVNCKIYQFEPTKKCIEELEAMPFENTKLLKSAVGSEPGTMKIYTTDQASSISSLYVRRDSYFQSGTTTEEEISIVTLDDVIKDEGLEIVDFMKMDIEGHEYAALEGAKNSLEKGKIKALTFEFGSANINSKTYFHDFWDLLTNFGYAIYRICPGGVLLPVESYYEDLEFFRGATNYLAVYEK